MGDSTGMGSYGGHSSGAIYDDERVERDDKVKRRERPSCMPPEHFLHVPLPWHVLAGCVMFRLRPVRSEQSRCAVFVMLDALDRKAGTEVEPRRREVGRQRSRPVARIKKPA